MTVFDEHTDTYEAWFAENAAVYRSELNAIKVLLPVIGNGIEIGVGSGLFAAPLGIARGIDPSEKMLELARARGIQATRGVAESLPFKNNTFAFVLMVTTVCFLDDIDLAFSEIYRVLDPRGHFVLGFVDKNSPIGRSYEARKDQSLFYKNATFYATKDLIAHLTNAGFGNFQFVQTLFQPLAEIRSIEPVREGYGLGSFVVIKAGK